ncbi:ER membrane protein complex subunit 4 [Coccinella septempunctata]|uniref:ER membrane protein complex subunit 4 n=1 Tax=Coccinella septempunctata TaxID=41139 RepID=UPI001D06E8A0|nr:ER membrane protein complex subunit 4 [Coccinella septempunctata]
MSKALSKRSKWSLDCTKNVVKTTDNLPAPPAYNLSNIPSSNEVTKKADISRLITKKSWDIALAPIKQVPMNLFIMYMAGNSISIFPIMMVGMLLLRPIQAIWATKSTFKVIETSAVGQMIIYILGNFVNIGLALYKCQSMGLLPTHSSDWLAFVEPPIRQEYLGGGFILE